MNITTRLLINSMAVVFGVGLAQTDKKPDKSATLYLLRDDSKLQWCGYADEPKFKSDVQSLLARNVAVVNYVRGRVASIQMNETDETGDWAVNDNYLADPNEVLQSLKRMINIIPEDNSEEQVFLLKGGHPVKESSNIRELRSGRPTANRVSWFEAPPVVASLQEFPFASLIPRLSDVKTTGRLCIPDQQK